jgi:hypothetical protein
MTDQEFQKMWDELKAKYPDAPLKAKPVECLNLIMRKNYAQAIVDGKKKVEFRAVSNHYYERLNDKDMLKFLDENCKNDPLLAQAAEDGVVDPLREVKKIHFHNYNNSWYLDVEVTETNVAAATKEDVDYLHEHYDCHDLDDVFNDLNNRKVTERPCYYIFGLGKILDTDLKKSVPQGD